MAQRLAWLVLISLLIAKLLTNGFSKPLAEVHWDSIVHLYSARLFSETALIKQFAQHASVSAAQVASHRSPEDGQELLWFLHSLIYFIILFIGYPFKPEC
jgi:hypothetical protein